MRRGIISVMSNGFDGKQLRRSREGRMVAGVCAGLAAYFGIDANVVRLIFAGLTCLVGSGILLYLVAWMIIPEEGESSSIAENFINKNKS
jgi:phage shock protein PspC (stress-responsive transcriptional regulator)